jgi:hypothetical protein
MGLTVNPDRFSCYRAASQALDALDNLIMKAL